MDRELLGTGIKKIAAGYLFLHIAIRLGSVDALPDWAGYLLMIQGIGMIGAFRESALLLKPLGLLLMCMEVAEWLFTFFGIPLEFHLFTVLFTIADLYFHFQMLTEIAEIGKETGPGYWKKICRLRTVKTILSTITAVTFLLPLPNVVLNGYDVIEEVVLPALVVVSLIVCLWIYFVLRGLAVELLSDNQVC